VKIIIAPDSFKGSLSAAQVANAIENGILRVRKDIELVKLPLADGGEGTVDAFLSAMGGKTEEVRVSGPLGEEVVAEYGIFGDKVVIEMAQSSGLPLVPEDRRNPLETTTFGLGQVILSALVHQPKEIIIGIGGSATIDGGCGMVQALGGKFFDGKGSEISGHLSGGKLLDIHHIDLLNLDPRLKDIVIKVACDVNNTLTGDLGAAKIYGPQKGATEEMVAILDEGLKNLALVVKNDLKMDMEFLPSAGAAGGLGGGLYAFLGAELFSGADMILETFKFEERLKGASYIFMGEGRMDDQSLMGKLPGKIGELGKKYEIPVIAIVGSYKGRAELFLKQGISAVFSNANGAMSLSQAMEKAESSITDVAEQIMRVIEVGLT